MRTFKALKTAAFLAYSLRFRRFRTDSGTAGNPFWKKRFLLFFFLTSLGFSLPSSVFVAFLATFLGLGSFFKPAAWAAFLAAPGALVSFLTPSVLAASCVLKY